MLNIEKNIQKMLALFPEEKKKHWEKHLKQEKRPIRGSDFLKLPPEERNIDLKYIDLFSVGEVDESFQGSILLCHFGMVKYEIEGLGLPIYLSKKFPNATIHTSFHKGDHIDCIFKIDVGNKKICFNQQTLDRYDFMIGRSTALLKMQMHYPIIHKKSGYKINIQTNSLKINMAGADYYFGCQEFFAPPDPVLLNRSKQNLKSADKQNIILLPGTVCQIKGQKNWMSMLDPGVVSDYQILIAGDPRDQQQVQEILKHTQNKNMKNVLFVGEIPFDLLVDLMCLSKITVMNHDFRPLQHPIGVSRTHGEGLGCLSFPLTPNKTVQVPPEWSHIGFQYDHEDASSVNNILDLAIKTVDTEKINWDFFTFQKMCDRICDRLMGSQ